MNPKEAAKARIIALRDAGHITSDEADKAMEEIEQIGQIETFANATVETLLRMVGMDYTGRLGGRMVRREDGMEIQNAGKDDHYWF